MNEKMAYEHIIAGKLETIPVPDIADAIWARIETQLDLDLPQDPSPDGGSTPRFPSGGSMIGGISILFVVVFVAFFIPSKKQNLTPSVNNKPASVTQPKQKEKETFPQINRDGAIPKTNNAVTTLPSNGPLLLDSNTNAITQGPTPIIEDSIVTNVPIAITPLPTQAKADTIATSTKKGRGVSGITDNDYRIVPKKDSTKN